MKNTVKRILSIVLVVALVATMGITAFAASVTLTGAPSAAIKVGATASLTASCNGTTGTHTISWESSKTTVATVTSGTVRAISKGSASISATCTCGASATAVIDVKCCDAEGCTCAELCTGGSACTCNTCTKTGVITISPAEPSVLAGGTVKLTATVKNPCTGAALTGVTYSWTETADNISLTGANTAECTVAATAVGTSAITLTCTKSGYTITQKTVNVAVKPAVPTATGGGTVYSYTGEDVALSVTAKNYLDTTAGLVYEWYKGSEKISSATAATYTIPDENIPTAGQTYAYSCKVYYMSGDTKSDPVTVNFSVKPIDKYTVSFADSLQSVTYAGNGSLQAKVVKNTITEAKTSYAQSNVTYDGASGVPGTKTVAWSVPNTNVLYFASGSSKVATSTGNPVTIYGNAVDTTGVTVTATYTADSKNYTATKTVKVQNNVEVTMNASASVLLGGTTESAKVTSVIDRSANKVAYDTAVSGYYYYEVTYTSDNTSVATVSNAAGTKGVVTGVSLGTAKITAAVTVWSDSTKTQKLAEVTKECSMTVVNSDFDICANLKSGSTITFTDANFGDWFKKQVGDTYSLNYIVLGAPSNSYGTFKYSGTSFTPNDITLFAAGRTGSYYITNTSYTAGSGSYYVTVPFTCYGGTTTTSSNVTRGGTLYILVNPGSVSTITYTMGTAAYKTLVENDFLSVYRTALNTTSSYITIDIKLLDIPESGDLYLDYVSAANPGTKITSSNFGSYTFTASSITNPVTAIDDLTYIPDTGAAGNDTIRYAVYVNGVLNYVARLVFDNGESDLVSYSEGRTFKKTDFYAATDVDPIVSVKLTQPDSGKGKLYTGYANGRGTLVTATDSYNTGTSVTTKDITDVTYIPPAGFEGNVTIKVTATTQTGTTKDINFVITVKSKTASTVFTDVTAKNTGSWSANAIDYAYKWGLVNGTTTTAPLKYGPAGNMTRAQFVAVLYRTAGSPSVAGLANPFTDVKNTTSTSWYYNAVIWAYNNKIVSGATATTFNPSGKITREQLAKMLYGFDQYIKGTAPTGAIAISDYTDYAKVSSYAVDSIKWAVGNGIITSASSSAKTINPQGTATRAQVATMLHRYLTK